MTDTALGQLICLLSHLNCLGTVPQRGIRAGGQQPGQLLLNSRIVWLEFCGFLETGDRFGKSALGHQNDAQISLRAGVVRFVLERGPKLTSRFFHFPSLRQNVPQIVVRLGIAGFKLDGLLVIFDRLVAPALPVKNIGKTVVAHCRVRVDLQRRTEFVLRFTQPAKFEKNRTQFDTCLDVTGFALNGFLTLCDGFLNFAACARAMAKLRWSNALSGWSSTTLLK